MAEIRARNIDVFTIDPFVSCHEVSENDNDAYGKRDLPRKLPMVSDRVVYGR